MRGPPILATGGLGQIYLRTTNPAGSRGDGLAMAYRAGARVINTEYVQFHPTAFYHRNAPCFLITEAVRGAGARLVDEQRRPFMDRYDPVWKDLAPRDVVARGIHSEMLRRGVKNVYLDLASYIPEERIRAEFPEMLRSCMEYGIDITRDLLPVVPAAHYACGGVWVDEHGHSTLERLYAVGEVSCTGLHGANRLASTSLLEGLVWGHRSAHHIAASLEPRSAALFDDIPPWKPTGTQEPDPALVAQDVTSIKNIMWNYVGLVRTDAAPRAGDPRVAQPRGRDRALLPGGRPLGRPDRAAQLDPGRADRHAGCLGESREPRLPLSRVAAARPATLRPGRRFPLSPSCA